MTYSWDFSLGVVYVLIQCGSTELLEPGELNVELQWTRSVFFLTTS